MKKILEMTPPIANSYYHHGILFSIFQNQKETIPWIINNFIQVYSLKNMHVTKDRKGTLDFFFNKYGDWKAFEFSANPWLKYESISYETLDLILKTTSLPDLIINNIMNEKYTLLPVDMFYLKKLYNNGNRHRIHFIFINGFDTEEKVFYCNDNFTNGKYYQNEITFNDLEAAYNSLFIEEGVAEWSENRGILAYKFGQTPWHTDKDELYKVNFKIIVNSLKAYLLLSGEVDEYKHISYYSYGIDCYNDLLAILDFGIDGNYVDHRAFCSMNDHKKVMVYRLKYLQKNHNVDLQDEITGYKDICEKFDIVIFKIVKGNTASDINQHIKCKDLLNSIKTKEIDLIHSIIKKLSK